MKCFRYRSPVFLFFFFFFFFGGGGDLHLSILNDFVSSKFYDKRDNFDVDIVHFPLFDGDVPRRTSYGVYIHSLLCLLVCSHVMCQASMLEIKV